MANSVSLLNFHKADIRRFFATGIMIMLQASVARATLATKQKFVRAEHTMFSIFSLCAAE
jgi:hypothetical protein